MKKLLNKVALKEQQLLKQNDKWASKDQYIQTLLDSNNGDIRSMISSFQFWTTSKDIIKIRDEGSSNFINNNIYLRNESISFFHSIGKIIYGSHDKDRNLIDDNEMINKLLSNNGYSYEYSSGNSNNKKKKKKNKCHDIN